MMFALYFGSIIKCDRHCFVKKYNLQVGAREKVKILVSGDRNWTDENSIREVLNKYDPQETILIHGAARGADTLAANVAAELGFKKILPFKADWKQYGRAAGPIRNGQMLTEGKPDIIIAFHSDIEASKGTKDMLKRAKKAGITTELHEE